MAKGVTRQEQAYPFYLAGKWEQSTDKLPVTSPYSGEVVGVTYLANDRHWQQAIEAAQRAFSTTRRMAAYERASALLAAADGIARAKQDLAELIVLEAGKPLKDARVEVDRAVLTFTTAAEEAKRITGQQLPLDFNAGTAGRWGIAARFPLGPILGITPFNFPLNLVAHKVAPALAAGNTIVVKPASKTPLSCLRLAQILDRCGFPPGAFSALPSNAETAERALADDRFKLLTFTGSAAVGWRLKAQSGKKRVLLELGGNAGVIVDQYADLAYAAERIAAGGFSFAGQSCVSVQRSFVHRAVHDAFADAFVQRARALKLGDPMDASTDLGPMISGTAAERTAQWVREAVAEGAEIITGGKVLDHNIVEPTVLANVNRGSKVCQLEVFAPLVDLFPFDDFDRVLAEVNETPYGLQAGIFTDRLDHAFAAFQRLEVGGVIVNDVPTWRIDPMPYGGTKDSGLGREGPRYAIEEMTELRLLAIAPARGKTQQPLPASG